MTQHLRKHAEEKAYLDELVSHKEQHGLSECPDTSMQRVETDNNPDELENMGSSCLGIYHEPVNQELVCRHCKNIYTTEADLNRHLETCNMMDTKSGPVKFKDDDSDRMEKLYQGNRGQKPFPCDQCGK